MSQQVETEMPEGFQPKKVEMTRAEFMKAEHALQTGETDVLPDGRKVSEVRESLFALQKQQEEDLKKRGQERRARYVESKGETLTKSDFLSEKLEVVVQESGATSARPLTETVEEEIPPPPPANELPHDFPGRSRLIAAGFTTIEAVKKLKKPALLKIEQIDEAAAEAILAYGKPE